MLQYALTHTPCQRHMGPQVYTIQGHGCTRVRDIAMASIVYGLYSYGPYSYGVYSYGIYSYGLYSYSPI